MNDPIGAFTFVLHSHIPYVLGHGVSPHGTDWLCEAAAESYIPLLDVCRRLIDEGVSPKITLGLTPVLVEQLTDPRFAPVFEDYLNRHILQALADAVEFRTSGSHYRAILAHQWSDWYSQALEAFTGRWNRDLVGAFRVLQDAGHIAIIAGSATHAYLPLLADDCASTQIAVGVASYRRHFGREPRGFWLPECGYRPGLERFLTSLGIQYFFAESARVTLAPPSGESREGAATSYAPYADRLDVHAAISALRMEANRIGNGVSPYAGHTVGDSTQPAGPILFFTRDPITGAQVWSSDRGYPGNPWYLEFHKHHAGADNGSLGLRYWRVTDHRGQLDAKQAYEPMQAARRVEEHANHFASLVRTALTANAPAGDGIVCSIYDTELFGHWWFEGPSFLYDVIKAIAAQPDIARKTCEDYVDAHPGRFENAEMTTGSWGAGGDDRMWFNSATAWAWDLIRDAEARLRDAKTAYSHFELASRLLRQAERELMLLSSSDWLFSLTTGAAADYATMRIRNHHDNFTALIALVRRVAHDGLALRPGDLQSVAECEATNRIFIAGDLR